MHVAFKYSLLLYRPFSDRSIENFEFFPIFLKKVPSFCLLRPFSHPAGGEIGVRGLEVDGALPAIA